MPKIYITDRKGEQHVFDAHSGDSLMEVIRDNDLDIEAICGGCCSCATCHVYIDQKWYGLLDEISEEELELLEDEQFYVETESRLSCQISIDDKLDGLVLKVAPPA